MRIRVRYFASLAEWVGRREECVEVADDADVARLWQDLVVRHPRLASWSPRPLVALDLEYATWDRPLRGVQEVAFLPPVSGG